MYAYFMQGHHLRKTGFYRVAPNGRKYEEKESFNQVCFSRLRRSRFGSSSFRIEQGELFVDNSSSVVSVDSGECVAKEKKEIDIPFCCSDEFPPSFETFCSFPSQWGDTLGFVENGNKLDLCNLPFEFWLALCAFRIKNFQFSDIPGEDDRFRACVKFDFNAVYTLIKSNYVLSALWAWCNSVWSVSVKWFVLNYLLRYNIITQKLSYSFDVRRVWDRCISFSNVAFEKKMRLSFITFTMSPKWGLSQKQFSNCFNNWVTRVNRYLKRKGRTSFSYVRVGEFQKNGTLHFHLLSNLATFKGSELRQLCLFWFQCLANKGVQIKVQYVKGKEKEAYLKGNVLTERDRAILDECGELVVVGGKVLDFRSSGFENVPDRLFSFSLENLTEKAFRIDKCVDSFAFGDIEHSFKFDCVKLRQSRDVMYYLAKYCSKEKSFFTDVYPVTCSRDIASLMTSFEVPEEYRHLFNPDNSVLETVSERWLDLDNSDSSDFECVEPVYNQLSFSFGEENGSLDYISQEEESTSKSLLLSRVCIYLPSYFGCSLSGMDPNRLLIDLNCRIYDFFH